MSKTAKKTFDAMMKCKEMGVSFNPIAESFIRDQYYKEEGIILVFECKKCKKRVECFVAAKEAICNAHGLMKKVWDVEKVLTF